MHILSWLLTLTTLVGSSAYSNGARDCNVPGHGTFKTPIPADMTLSLIDPSTSSSVSLWTAGKTYTVQIQTTSSNFKGWSWAPLKGTPASFTAGSSSMAGSFTAGDSYSHVNTGCPGSITQTSGGTSRTLIKASWTAPAAGTGTVSLWAMMTVSKNGNNYNAVQIVDEAPVSGSSPTATGTKAAGVVSSSRAISGTATGTRTGTAGATPAASASYGASESASSSIVPTPSESSSVVAAGSSSSSPVAVSPTVTAQAMAVSASQTPAAVIPAPISAPNNQISSSTTNSVNIVAIAAGSAIAGAAMVAISVVVVMTVNRRKVPLKFEPTMMRTVNPSTPQDVNPYMVNGATTKVAFNPTSARFAQI